MKFRSDFVTNSSSSSYICEICGDIESGYDQSPEELGMLICEKGHTICNIHKQKNLKIKEKLQYIHKLFLKNNDLMDYLIKYCNINTIPNSIENENLIDDIIEKILEYTNSSILSLECPICNFKVISDDDRIKYLFKKLNSSAPKIDEEILQTFNSYEDFKAKLYENNNRS